MTPTKNFGSRPFGVNGASQRSLGKPPARYPAAVATDSDLIIAVDRQQTTLTAPMGPGDNSITVANPSIVTAYNLLSIDNEIVKTTGPPAGNVIPVSRGFDGTTPAVHLASATVSGFIDAYHHNALVAEIEAIEQTLGPNFHLPVIPPAVTLPFLVSTNFDFAPQSPGGTLSTGNQVITLAPVPQGVNGSDTNHYLYIQGGTGTAEAVPITGGTAVSGAANGTVIVNCAYTHSGAWTIQSATRGIQEAITYAGTNPFHLYIPAGTYHIYGPIYVSGSQFASIQGAGRGITILAVHMMTGDMVYIAGNPESYLIFGGLNIARGAGYGTSDVALHLKSWVQNAIIHNIGIDSPYDGIVLDGAQPTMRDIWVHDFQHYGIHGIGTQCGGAWYNIDCGNNLGTGTGSSAPNAVKIESTVDGLYCTGCGFGGTDFAFWVDPGTGYASNLWFENCLFERYKTVGYFQQADVGGSGGGILFFVNCRFISRNVDTDSRALMLVSAGGGNPKIDTVLIDNCYIALNIESIRLAGVSNVTIRGNTICGTMLTSMPGQTGIVFDAVTGGTSSVAVTISGNTIGYGLGGVTTRDNTDWHGGPLETPISIGTNTPPATHHSITITGNVMSGLSGNPISLSMIPTQFVLTGNTGIDDVSYVTIASAATVAFTTPASFNAYPFFTLSGNVAVTAVSGLWEGAKGSFLASGTTPGTWTAGASIGNTFTPVSNGITHWEFRGGKIWLK